MDIPAIFPLDVTTHLEQWPLAVPLQITGYTFTVLDVMVLTVSDGEREGRAEAVGIYYRKDTPERMVAQIAAMRNRIAAGVDRNTLRSLMPAGGARNALDCALWDLQAQRSGLHVWQLAGLSPPRPLVTTYTVGADEPQKMADAARLYTRARALKLKLTGDDADAERVRAVRAARSDVWMSVDANQGFNLESLRRLMPVFLEAQVQLIEQPFPVGQESQLDAIESPIPIAADESLQTLEDLPGLAGRFDTINIKLDKCGGLTEGLAIARRARELNLQVMVGNMIGTSLAMAPAFVLGQLCSLVDLDGPIWLANDRSPTASYEDGRIWCPPQVWGAPSALSLAGT
jgi:L-Ala-D/L-Glu epimerase